MLECIALYGMAFLIYSFIAEVFPAGLPSRVPNLMERRLKPFRAARGAASSHNVITALRTARIMVLRCISSLLMLSLCSGQTASPTSPSPTPSPCSAPPGYFCSGGSALICPIGAYCVGGANPNVPCYPVTACAVQGISAATGQLWATGVDAIGIPVSTGTEIHWRAAALPCSTVGSCCGGNCIVQPYTLFSPAVFKIGVWPVVPVSAAWLGSLAFPSGWSLLALNFTSAVGFTIRGSFANDDTSGSVTVFPSSNTYALPITSWSSSSSFTIASSSPSTSIAFTMGNNFGSGPGGGGIFIHFSSLVLSCPDGFGSSATSSSPLQAVCLPCLSGTFSKAFACQRCPGGHYCPAGTSSWARLNCGRGNYCPDGSSAPTPCPYQVPPSGGWGALQVQGPAFLVETAHCLNHCFWNLTSGDGMLSKC